MCCEDAVLGKEGQTRLPPAVSFLATRVNRCTTDDLIKLQRLMQYMYATKERGLVFSPGKSGIEVSVLIDTAYGVHRDGKSHTGSCVVIGELGAVHCKSSKQQIMTKSSTEAKLAALSGPLIKHYTSGISC